MKARVLVALAVAGWFWWPGTAGAQGTIVGSQHDFSAQGWSGGKICIACHTPHAASTTVTTAPLWNHASTTKAFALYTSPSLNASVGQPASESKLCLSCHDGTVAVDSFGGTIGTTYLSGPPATGAGAVGLADDHPVSFVFDTTLANADGALADPATRTVTIGSGARVRTGTVQSLLLSAGRLECSSCHDVHNDYVAGPPLLKVSDSGSQLCLTCHVK